MANSTAAVANECSSRCSASELRRKVRVQVKADLSNVHCYKLNLKRQPCFKRLAYGSELWQHGTSRWTLHVNRATLIRER